MVAHTLPYMLVPADCLTALARNPFKCCSNCEAQQTACLWLGSATEHSCPPTGRAPLPFRLSAKFSIPNL